MVVLATARDGDRVAGGDLRARSRSRARRCSSASCRASRSATRREQEIGQVYVPAVNWGIFVAVVALVIGFGSSEHLAAAYGIAVTGTLAIDTVLFFVVVRKLWHKPLWLVIPGAAAFLIVDLTFFARQPHRRSSTAAGSRSLIALIVFVVLTTWQRGREIVTRNRTRGGGAAARRSSRRCTRWTRPSHRVAAAPRVFLNANRETTPLALRANVEHNHVAARARGDRLVVQPSASRTSRGRAPHGRRPRLRRRRDHARHGRFGFQDTIDVPAALRQAAEQHGARGRPRHRRPTSSRASRSSRPTRPGWRAGASGCSARSARNAANPVDLLRPARRAHGRDGPHIEL